jgi:Leucine-rich repeat (LRR) protein
MPIISFEADETNGVITITVSGENLSEEFFTGTQEASAALHISDGNNSIVSAGIQILSKIDIPDLALKKYLVDNYDYDGNGEISIAEAENITMVNCSGKGVANLIGLESCTNLVTLDCSNNNITKIELPNLAQLETVTCNDCPIELMNFSGCTSLQNLNLQDATTNAIIGNKLQIKSYNQAESLTIDVSNTSLDHIFVCRSEILAHLDISKNTQLKHLEAYVNPNLKSIDVSKLVNLEILDLGDCDLTNVDVSKNLMLTELYVTNNKLSTIDVNQNKQLKVLKCKGNQISNLNVSNNDKLETLILEDNKLSAINVSNNTALAYLNINNNAEISIVDVKTNKALTNLYCNGLAIGELNIVNNTALTKLECHTNKNLTTLTCGNAFANATNRVIVADKSLNILNVNGQKVPYRVGDLIKDGSCWGVVFSISSTTKIMSIAETSCNWNSAETWCSNYGSGWYLPSAEELRDIYDQISTINSTLSAHSFTTIGTKEYWSSTEDKYNYKEARVLSFSAGGSYYTDKSKSCRVRAVLAF